MAREKQTTPIITGMSDSAELGPALEDTGGLSGFGAQKQASVRFGSAPMHQSSETILLKPTQSLVAAVDKLISLTECQFLAPLKAEDYRKLIAARDKLINAIGTDENHPLTPLMHFMGNLIEKYKKNPNMEIRNETLDTDMSLADADSVLKPHRPEKTGRPANLPRLKLADLLAQEPKTAEHSKPVRTSLKPHRPEKTGRPANLPRLKLADLLAQEPEHAASDEIDTGPAVGHEVW